jgi:hypothetical protein
MSQKKGIKLKAKKEKPETFMLSQYNQKEKSRSLSIQKKIESTSIIPTRNNFIYLKISADEIKKIEKDINVPCEILLDDDNEPIVQKSSSTEITEKEGETNTKNIGGVLCGLRSSSQLSMFTKSSRSSQSSQSPKGSLASLGSIVKKEDKMSNSSKIRKNLIINSGVERKVNHAIHITNDKWPSSSIYACMYCCHTFNTSPVGIPYCIINYKFMCYGNFCSYNCAKRYLCPTRDDEDDMACIQTYNDLYVGDDHGEKLQLLELLYHLETGAPIHQSIKPSPKRLVLKLFGGTKTIEEYRESFDTNTTFHVFKTPIASIGYQIEECSDTLSDSKRVLRNLSLDADILEKKREKLLDVKNKISKILTNAPDTTKT